MCSVISIKIEIKHTNWVWIKQINFTNLFLLNNLVNFDFIVLFNNLINSLIIQYFLFNSIDDSFD